MYDYTYEYENNYELIPLKRVIARQELNYISDTIMNMNNSYDLREIAMN